MYNPNRGLIEEITSNEVDFVREAILPVIKIGRGPLFRNGNGYRLGFDHEEREAILFKSGHPIVNPNRLDQLIYRIIDEELEKMRNSNDNKEDYSRFKI